VLSSSESGTALCRRLACTLRGKTVELVEPDDLVKWGTSLPGNLVNGPALNFFPTFLPAAEPREGSRASPLGPLRASYLNARSFTHTQPRREKSSAERPRVRIFIPARLRPLSFDSPITDGRPLRSGRRRRCRPPRRRSCREKREINCEVKVRGIDLRWLEQWLFNIRSLFACAWEGSWLGDGQSPSAKTKKHLKMQQSVSS